MATELQVLGYAALLQFAQFVLLAGFANTTLGSAYLGGPRDERQEPEGITGRVMRAHDNHLEALALFTIAVLVVVLGDASTENTVTAAWVYLIARIVYVPAYMSGIPMVRSLIWAVGQVATLTMLISALF